MIYHSLYLCWTCLWKYFVNVSYEMRWNNKIIVLYCIVSGRIVCNHTSSPLGRNVLYNKKGLDKHTNNQRKIVNIFLSISFNISFLCIGMVLLRTHNTCLDKKRENYVLFSGDLTRWLRRCAVLRSAVNVLVLLLSPHACGVWFLFSCAVFIWLALA